jgi:hypothetical protein
VRILVTINVHYLKIKLHGYEASISGFN